MITGVHTLFFSDKADETRAFLLDKLGFGGVDVGSGWWIFKLPPAEMGVHPSETDNGHVDAGTADISFMCDDLEATIAELQARGVEFTTGINDQGWGRTTRMKVPGDFEVTLYQPKYSKP